MLSYWVFDMPRYGSRLRSYVFLLWCIGVASEKEGNFREQQRERNAIPAISVELCLQLLVAEIGLFRELCDIVGRVALRYTCQ